MKKPLLLVLSVVFLCGLFSSNLLSQIQVGEYVTETYETSHPYQGKGGVVWEQTFHWPEASYISIHFSQFDLASSDYVEISSPDGQYVYKYDDKGKLVKQGKERISQFWAVHIPGDTAEVKLYGKGNKNGWGFVIDRWARGYESDIIRAAFAQLEGEDVGLEAICGTNDKEWAPCYDGTTMYNEARAVCRLLINGSSACTGWLLGSEGHIMTNNHCIDSQTDADNTDYEFMAEGATCSTSCSSWMACPGTVEASSGDMIQTDSNLDYTLVLLPGNLTSTYGYMQFRDTLPVIDERIYIPQHPSAYGKQIAVYSTHSTDASGYCEVYSTDATPCMGGPGDIGYYADTEGGSSGSPVLAYTDHLVVSLHHCANCPNRGVPIPSIISDLGANIPDDAVGGGPVNPPVADFTSDKTSVMAGGSVNFTDQSSNSPTSWSWTFDGGTPGTSTAQNPTITYNSPGVYTVSLTAANDAGSDTETKTDYITVTALEVPVADFTASSTTIEAGQSVSFTDQSTGNPNSWSWTFNGGTPGTSTAQNPTVTYNTVGTYTVTLTAANAAGSDTETKVDYITVNEPTIQYCTSSGSNQNYEYIAGVEVADLYNTSGASGYTDYTSMFAHLTAGANVSVALTPGFVGSSYSEYWKIWIDYNKDGDFSDSGEEVFSGSGNSVVSGNFTVPATATGSTRMRVSMSYSTYPPVCGTFTYGEVEDYTVDISGGTVEPPVAQFSASSTAIETGQSVTFTDQSTNSPTSWSWTFNGGTPGTSTTQNPTVTYNTAGTYTVSLTVANSAGSDTETKVDYITVTEPTIQYCTSSGNSQNYEYIVGVEVGDLNNTSGASGYTDFTAISANLNAGANVSVALTPGFPGSSYTEYWKIWIDYNKDGDFDDSGEEVFSGSGSSVVSGSFTVPTSTASTTRMRISMRYGGQPSSCGTFTYGEVEDYTVNIAN